jgi:F0F1-type ATP synthase assembly protein I
VNTPSSGTSRSLGQGMDIALVVLVFLGLGAVLDRWLGTKPLFMISMVVLALVGSSLRLWYSYDAEMRALEAERQARTTPYVAERSVT